MTTLQWSLPREHSKVRSLGPILISIVNPQYSTQ